MAKVIKVPQLSWYGPRELELPLPDSWNVDVRNFAGYNRPAVTDAQIREALEHPIGSRPIRELAKGKKEVAIIFDDIHRPTRVSRVLPFVLEELAKAGIPDDNIRFIAAGGTHAAMDLEDFTKKLGKSIPGKYRCYNHNPFYNCTYIGTTSRGTKVSVNSEFAECDFRIGIGSITPHLFAVFSGGGKIILPGISSIDTIFYNHGLPCDPADKFNYDKNPVPLDMFEAADLAHLDVNIEGLINLWGDTTNLYVGELRQSHEVGVQAAKEHYFTQKAKNKDIVIANAYAKVTESAAGLGTAFPSLKKEGGDIVVICNAPSGQCVHYLAGPWGKIISPKARIQIPIPPHVNRLIVFTEYPDLSGLGYIQPSPKVIMVHKWDDVVSLLQETHGDNADVAVYPNADIQQWPRE